MTLFPDPMPAFLNFHAHRAAVSPAEAVVRNLVLPLQEPDEAEKFAGSPFSAGIHPWYIPARTDEALAELDSLASCPSCVAIGEAGLDKLASASMDVQCGLFRRQALLAAAHGLPLVVHCVRAWGELLALRREFPQELVCVVHGFRGKPELARSLLDKGFWLSFGFRFHPQSLALCPPDRLFLETDEDPRPVDGLYRTASALRGCCPEDLATQCRENLANLARKLKK